MDQSKTKGTLFFFLMGDDDALLSVDDSQLVGIGYVLSVFFPFWLLQGLPREC